MNKILDLHGKPIGSDGASALDMEVVELIGPLASVCCKQLAVPYVMKRGGVVILCSKCKKIIGYMAPEDYASMFHGIPNTIMQTMNRLGIKGGMSHKDIFIEFERGYRETLLRVSRRLIEIFIKKKFGGGDSIGDEAEEPDDGEESC